MRERCHNPNTKQYEDYGGRGISICQRWEDFNNFLADMGEQPVGMCIERIDNDADYSPSNCKWATRAEQVRNRRNNVWLEAMGKRMILKDWANFLGYVNPMNIKDHFRRGHSLEDIIVLRLAS